MSRFFAPRENVKGNLIYIDGREARHILNVMRLVKNDKVVVFDGTGKEYVGFIKEIKAKSLIVEVAEVKKSVEEPHPNVTLAQCIPKKEKMDYIVEKTTELGVSCILPVISQRTIVKFKEGKAEEKLNRWRKISEEASKQCGRVDVPCVKNIQKFDSCIREADNFDLALVATLSNDTIDLKNALSGFKEARVIVFIGPEGDFTPAEMKIAKDTRCKFISLGNNVLKCDTASLYVLSILNYEFTR